jgi:preprotein translocase subunit SecF
MFQLLVGVNVDWMRRRHIAYMVSGACVLIAVLSLIMHGGPRYGVDFTGGTLMEIGVTPAVSADAVRKAADAAGFAGAEIQKLDRPGQVLIRVGPRVGKSNPSGAIAAQVRAENPSAKVEVLRVESVGPRVGNELRSAAVKAVFLALVLILIYVAIRYDWRYSLGAVAALFHDVFISLGAVSLTNREVTLTVVAALLTIAGFSINDTIVVFDRIRERGKALRREKPETVMNIAVNETLSRTIITSFTVFLTVMALFLLGGEVIHDFSFTMLVGVVFGTYSSVYVASALALDTQLYLERSKPGRPKK